MTKTNFGGDIVHDESTEYNTMEYLWNWRRQLKDLPNHHSVAGNHDDGNATNNLFSQEYVYGYLLGPEETDHIVRDRTGMYYYIDNGAEHTRYLYLDTAYKGVTDAQLAFVKQALLTAPDDWHIVAIAHIWYDTDYTTSPPSPGSLNSGAARCCLCLTATTGEQETTAHAEDGWNSVLVDTPTGTMTERPPPGFPYC